MDNGSAPPSPAVDRKAGGVVNSPLHTPVKKSIWNNFTLKGFGTPKRTNELNNNTTKDDSHLPDGSSKSMKTNENNPSTSNLNFSFNASSLNANLEKLESEGSGGMKPRKLSLGLDEGDNVSTSGSYQEELDEKTDSERIGLRDDFNLNPNSRTASVVESKVEEVKPLTNENVMDWLKDKIQTADQVPDLLNEVHRLTEELKKERQITFKLEMEVNSLHHKIEEILSNVRHMAETTSTIYFQDDGSDPSPSTTTNKSASVSNSNASTYSNNTSPPS